MRMRKQITRFTSLIIICLALSSCSSTSVTSDWDHNIDFAQFRTFSVLKNPAEQVNRLVDQRIRNAIVADLMSRGMHHADTQEQADLAFAYQVTTQERTSYQTVHRGWSDYRFRTARWDSSVGTSRTTQRNYTVGTLIIAAFEMGSNELVWESTGSRIINQASNPEQSVQMINDVVQQTLRDFPPAL